MFKIPYESFMKNEWLSSVLACPYCITPNITRGESKKIRGFNYFQCSICNRIFPVDKYGVIDFQVIDKILALPEPYYGMWALAQHGSLDDYKGRIHGSIAHPDREIVKSFSNFMDLSGKIVLDIGSGTDYTPGYIENQNVAQYVALDPLPVEQNVPYTKVQAWAEFMPFVEKSFDVAILATSLDHIVCLESLLEEVNRVVKDDGYIYVWGAWFTDETWFRNIPPEKLFIRDETDILPKSKSIEIYRKCKQTLKMKYQDVSELQQKYSQYLVDKWHFRHIPFRFIRKIEKFGFEAEKLELWEINYHNETSFMNGFLKFNKKAFWLLIRNENLREHLDILTLVTKLFEKIYFVDQKVRQIESEQNTINQGTETTIAIVNTIAQGITSLDERIKGIEEALRFIKIGSAPEISHYRLIKQYFNTHGKVKIRKQLSKVITKLQNFIATLL